MFRKSLLFFAFSVASYDCAMIPDMQNFGNIGLHRDQENRSSQFGEGARDWLRNMRDKMFGSRDHLGSGLLKSMDLNTGPSMLNLAKNMDIPGRMVSMVMNSPQMMIDIAKLKLNPETDRGFRVGNWYLIHKGDINGDTSVPKNIDDDWKDFFDIKDDSDSRTCECYANVIKSEPKIEDISHFTTTIFTSLDDASVDILKSS